MAEDHVAEITASPSLGKRRIPRRATCQIGHWDFPCLPRNTDGDDREQPCDNREEDDDDDDETDEDVGDWIEEDDGDAQPWIKEKIDSPTQEYSDLVEAYRGFYIGEWDVPIEITGARIWRCSKFNCDEAEIRKAAEFGIMAYSEQLKKENEDTVDLRPIKVVRANKKTLLRGAKRYFMTIQASDDKFYEARVFESRDDYELEFMRLAVHYPQIKETYFSFDI